MRNSSWPALDYAKWKDTGAAVHRWAQIVGKYRLAASPWVNHSWHATFYVTPRGLTTGPVHVGQRAVTWTFDLKDHLLIGESSSGARVSAALGPMSVATFFRQFQALGAELGSPVEIHGSPNEIPGALPFAEDLEERPYDTEAVEAMHGALVQIDRVLQRFRTGFTGKVSPVHLFWGSFDLAVTRFSGRAAPPHPGGIPKLPDAVTREAYSHEVSSAGFWPGGGGIDEACFYAYAYPGPVGFADAPVRPRAARWFAPLGEFVLPYEAVRTAADPDAALLAFLESTWEAAATLGDWPHDVLESPYGRRGAPHPTPGAFDGSHPGDLGIELEERPDGLQYVARHTDEGIVGELQFQRPDPAHLVVERTSVPKHSAGHDVSLALAARLLRDAEAAGAKVTALCPTFLAHVERHPPWQGHLTRSNAG